MPDPARPDPPLLAEAFTRVDVGAVRHAVTRAAAEAGLAGQRLEDYVLAVNEIVTNAVRYADGRGRVQMWASAGQVCCEVTDTGPGIPAEWIDRAPSPDLVAGGRGLWMARQLSDDLDVRTGPEGTAVRLSVALNDDRSAPTRDPAAPVGPPPPWPPIPPADLTARSGGDDRRPARHGP